jgi:hypothetical protein
MAPRSNRRVSVAVIVSGPPAPLPAFAVLMLPPFAKMMESPDTVTVPAFPIEEGAAALEMPATDREPPPRTTSSRAVTVTSPVLPVDPALALLVTPLSMVIIGWPVSARPKISRRSARTFMVPPLPMDWVSVRMPPPSCSSTRPALTVRYASSVADRGVACAGVPAGSAEDAGVAEAGDDQMVGPRKYRASTPTPGFGLNCPALNQVNPVGVDNYFARIADPYAGTVGIAGVAGNASAKFRVSSIDGNRVGVHDDITGIPLPKGIGADRAVSAQLYRPGGHVYRSSGRFTGAGFECGALCLTSDVAALLEFQRAGRPDGHIPSPPVELRRASLLMLLPSDRVKRLA